MGENNHGAAMPQQLRADGKTEEVLYCVCKKPATAPDSMVTCQDCQGWFHISCVLPEDADLDLLSKYFCNTCQQANGKQIRWRGKSGKKRKQEDDAHAHNIEKKEDKLPKKAREEPEMQTTSPPQQEKRQAKQEPVRRSARAKVKHNYSELNDGAEHSTPDKSIVVDYVKMLKRARCVMKSDTIPHRMRGEDLTIEFLSECGFREPILVDNLESLDMKMPPTTITVNRIKELVGMLFVLFSFHFLSTGVFFLWISFFLSS